MKKKKKERKKPTPNKKVILALDQKVEPSYSNNIHQGLYKGLAGSFYKKNRHLSARKLHTSELISIYTSFHPSQRENYIAVMDCSNLLFFQHVGWYDVLKKAMVFKQRRPWSAKTPLMKKTGVNIGTNMANAQRRQAIAKWLLIVRWSPLHWHAKSCCCPGGDA